MYAAVLGMWQVVPMGCGQAARRFAVALFLGEMEKIFYFLLAIEGKLHV